MSLTYGKIVPAFEPVLIKYVDRTIVAKYSVTVGELSGVSVEKVVFYYGDKVVYNVTQGQGFTLREVVSGLKMGCVIGPNPNQFQLTFTATDYGELKPGFYEFTVIVEIDKGLVLPALQLPSNL